VRPADDPAAAAEAARAILGLTIGGHAVESVLVEPKAPIARELYAAVVSDAATRGPLVLFSTEGGMEIEEVAASRPEACAERRSTSWTASGLPRRRRSWPGWTSATPPLPSPPSWPTSTRSGGGSTPSCSR
jgi:hypothetical protein